MISIKKVWPLIVGVLLVIGVGVFAKGQMSLQKFGGYVIPPAGSGGAGGAVSFPSGTTSTGQTSTSGTPNVIPMGLFTTSGVSLATSTTNPLLVDNNGNLLVDTTGTAQIWDGVNRVVVMPAGMDAMINGQASLMVTNNNMVYNNAAGNWDRQREATTSSLSNLTGVAGFMPYTVYENSPVTLVATTTSPFVSNSTGALNVDETLAPQYEDNTNGVAAVASKPLAVNTYSWTLTNVAPSGTVNVKASSGNVFSLNCESTSTQALTIQIHNTATTPSTGAVADFAFPIAASAGGLPSDTLIDGNYFGQQGYNESSGIAIAISATNTGRTFTPVQAIPGQVFCQIMSK